MRPVLTVVMDVLTDSHQVRRLEVVESGRRRRWTESEKLKIVQESLAGPRLTAATARRHGVSRQLLLNWRKAWREGRLGGEAAATGFVPAVLTPPRERPGRTGCIGREPRRDCDGEWPPSHRRGGHRCRRSGSDRAGLGATMIPLPAGVRVWLATGYTDMRKGFPSLALQVQEILHRDPLGGHLFCFRGRRGNLLKVIWHDGQGACLFTKRLERGRFLWPSPADGVVTISSAQLGYLLSGIDWRNPQETWRPTSVG